MWCAPGDYFGNWTVEKVDRKLEKIPFDHRVGGCGGGEEVFTVYITLKCLCGKLEVFSASKMAAKREFKQRHPDCGCGQGSLSVRTSDGKVTDVVKTTSSGRSVYVSRVSLTKAAVCVQLPAEIAEWIAQTAAEERRSKTSVIVELLIIGIAAKG